MSSELPSSNAKSSPSKLGFARPKSSTTNAFASWMRRSTGGAGGAATGAAARAATRCAWLLELSRARSTFAGPAAGLRASWLRDGATKPEVRGAAMASASSHLPLGRPRMLTIARIKSNASSDYV